MKKKKKNLSFHGKYVAGNDQLLKNINFKTNFFKILLLNKLFIFIGKKISFYIDHSGISLSKPFFFFHPFSFSRME